MSTEQSLLKLAVSEEAPPGAGASPIEDSQLVEACRRDPVAFTHLYHKYLRPVYRYHYARCGSPAEAEDLTSQTFLAALEALPRYREQGCFAAWLFAIARRKAIDHHRKAGAVSLEALPLLADPQPGPAHLALAADERRRLTEALSGLDEDQRELLRLRFAAGLPFDEIAALLRRSTPAVKMALYRLLERLERQMEAEHER